MNVKIGHTFTYYVSSILQWRCCLLTMFAYCFLIYRVMCTHIQGDVGSSPINACTIYFWLNWYRNYKHKFKLARVSRIQTATFLVHTLQFESTVRCCRHGSSQWHRPRVCLNVLLHRRRRQSWRRKHQNGTNRSQCLHLQWTVIRRTRSSRLIPSFHLRLTLRTCSPSFSYCSSPTVNRWRTRKFVALSPLRYLDK